MQKKILDEWQILREGKSGDFLIIALITMLFLTVIGLNVKLVFQLTANQTEQIGQMQLESIRADFQEVLSKAEDATTQTASEVAQLIAGGATQDELRAFIVQRKKDQKVLSNGTCFNLYGASRDWTIIPDFDMPEDYHAPERNWYKGAIEHPDEVFITEPYIDAASGVMCFTMSKALPDHQTVVGLDFNFTDVQASILRMNSDKDRSALIVNKYGMIIGYSDMSLVGEKISRKLPEYEPVLEQVVKNKNHDSFVAFLDGADHTIFSSKTNNGWFMILSVDDKSLYRASYNQLIFTGAISLVMLVAIIVFYLNGVKNRIQAEKALRVKEEFLSHMSRELRDPLNRILRLSNIEALESVGNPLENAAQVRESALQLSDMIDNLLSFSTITAAKNDVTSDEKVKQGAELSKTSQYARVGIIFVLIFAMTVSMGLCIDTTINWGDTKMNREVDIYEHQLSNWIEKQRSILSMFTNLIAERPEVMDDYASAVKLLDDIAKNYPEISVCYLANPYKEHTVIMNNGWEGPPGWRVDQRPWYIETERSEDGFSVSAPYYDDQTGVYCVTISQVVYGKNEEFLGIFAIDFYIDRLIAVLGESYTRNGYAFLVDRNGIIINHPNKNYEMSSTRMTDVNGTEYQRAYATNEVVRVTDYNHMPFACLAKKNAASQFTVIVAGNWWNIYGNIVTLGVAFALFLIICIVAVKTLIDRLLRWQQSVNQQLRAAADAAVAAGQAKSQFLAQMSHEIRTPLNAVLGMNEMILRESAEQSIREYAFNIQSAGHTLLTLINSILDFSKIEDGKMRIVPVRYDTAMMIDDLVNMISERAKKKGLEFKTEIDPTLPRSLYGDDLRIKQVITNLLTNAVKYTKQGAVTLSIGAQSIDADALKLHVAVRDTGIGIRAEDMDKLFQSFQRLDEEKNHNIEGTGLGISIVQRLLVMMGSELKVSSVYGEGSTFEFTIDQKIIDAAPLGTYGEHHLPRSQPYSDKKYLQAPHAKIMVVDDNSMNLKVMRGLLKANAIVPELVSSGLECLERVREQRYDIIFLDHMMPEPDGVETLKRLRAEHLIDNRTAVIALTANAISGAQETYMKAGFDGFLPKPIDTDALEAMLERYLPKEAASMKETVEQPTVEEPIEEPTIEEPIEEPTIEEPTVEKPTVEEPTVEEPTVEKPTVEKPTVEKPTVEEAVEEAVDDDSFTSAEKKLLSETCPSIDLAAALSSCMDSKDFVLEMMNDFVDDDKSEELQRSFDGGDWKNYRIVVHALKSTALIVGALGLSEEAKILELASKDGDVETLEKNHDGLIKNYAAIREGMKKFLSALE